MSQPENAKTYLSYYGDKQDINDQFFNNVQKIKTEKKGLNYLTSILNQV